MPKRLTIDQIRHEVEKAGFTLLSNEYQNKNSIIEYRCDKGHICSIRWVSFQARKKCFWCSGDIAVGVETVRKELFKEGYELLSNEYKNNKDKLLANCPIGHKWFFRWNDFQQGYRCGQCCGNVKHSIDFIRSEFEKRGFVLLSDHYKNNHDKLKYRCPEGHIGSIEWNNFRDGYGCLECAGSLKYTIEQVVSEFEKHGYTLLSKVYVNTHTKLNCVCPVGHEWSVSFSSFLGGARCVSCYRSASTSKAEKELFKYVDNLTDCTVFGNCVGIIGNKELDIYIPSKKLAIEYCGLYWHSEVSGRKNKKYHREKYDLCKEKGIRLITIFEDEYLEKPEVVRSRIRNALGLVDKRVYARKTEFKHLSKQQAQGFLYESHVQGYSPCRYRFGLFYGDELVQVMTFGKVSRAHASGDGVWEMKRLASAANVSVVCGASKLFKNALKFMLSVGEKVSVIKSYCDLRWAASNTVYESLGFGKVSETKYTPHYVRNGNRYRNQSLAKTETERVSGRTEWELRQSQGYDRVWDCGHTTYVYEVK